MTRKKVNKMRQYTLSAASVLLASFAFGFVAPSVLSNKTVDATSVSPKLVDLKVTVTIDNEVQAGYPKTVRTYLSEFETSSEFKAIKAKFGANPRVSYSGTDVTIEYTTRTDAPQAGFELELDITGYEFNGVRPFTTSEKRDKAIERLKAKYDIKVDKTNPSKWLVTGTLKVAVETTTVSTTSTTAETTTTTTGTTSTTAETTTTTVGTTSTAAETTTTTSDTTSTAAETTATTAGTTSTTAATTVTTGARTELHSRITLPDYYGSGVEVEFSTEEGAETVEVLRHIEPTSANPVSQLIGKDYDIYDIKVKDKQANLISQLKYKAIVKLPVDAGKLVEAVVHISDAGQVQDVAILKQENGFVYFEAEHFSLYGIVYKATATTGSRTPVTPVKSVTTQAQTSASSKQTTKVKSTKTNQLPKTGDEVTLYSLIGSMILAILTLLGLKKKSN